MRGTGADRPVVVMKPGNAGGAKRVGSLRLGWRSTAMAGGADERADARRLAG